MYHVPLARWLLVTAQASNGIGVFVVDRDAQGVQLHDIRTIDGQPLVQSLFAEADNDALFDQKVAKVAQMYPTVINRIYRAVMDAEKEFVELATKLGKLDG